MRADSRPHGGVSQPLEPPRAVQGSPRAFVIAFALALLATISPSIAFVARATALGEVDLFDTPQGLTAEVLHGTLVEHLAEYKLQMTLALHPEVIAVGSSRVMKWRGVLFDGCGVRRDCFYNAGGSMATIREAEEFVRDVLTSYSPRVILLDVAHWHFDPNFIQNDHLPVDLEPSLVRKVQRAVDDLRELARTTVDDSRLRATLLGRVSAQPGHRGVRAIVRDGGFARDGSRREHADEWATIERSSPADRTAEIVQRAREGYRFASFDKADAVSLRELGELLSLAEQHGVKVIAFIDPYADDVAQAIAEQPRISNGYIDVEAQLASVFASHDVPFFHDRRMSDIGCPPSEAVDGYHIGEVCTARLLRRILANPQAASTLAPYVTATHLLDIIAARADDLLLVPR